MFVILTVAGRINLTSIHLRIPSPILWEDLFMKPRLTLVALGLIALAMMSLGLQAQDPPKATTQEKDEILTSEQRLMVQFGEFQTSLLKLKLQLARGTPEDRKRAEALGQVLDEGKNL